LKRGLRASVAAWGIVLYVGCRAIDIVLQAQSLAAAVGQVVLVEWGSSRLGVTWSDPTPPTSNAATAWRVAAGAAWGFLGAALLFGTLFLSRSVGVEAVAHIEVSVLAIGLGTAALHSWRDELLFHGITLRMLEGTPVSPVFKVLACGVTSAGAALGRSDSTARSVVVAALLGIAFGALWVQDRGAWQPSAAHAAFRWSTGTLLSGGIVHSRLADNAWAGGNAGMLGGTAAVIALAPACIFALGWTAQRISPRSA